MKRVTWTIARNEIVTQLKNKGLIISVFGLPLLVWLIFLGYSAFNETAAETARETIIETVQSTEGYIDPTGLISELPPDLPAGRFRKYPDESSALVDYQSGRISGYYVIPKDYLATGKITVVRPDFRFLDDDPRAELMEAVLRFNVLGGDTELFARFAQPMNLSLSDLAGDSGEVEASIARERFEDFIPFGLAVIFYMLIATAAGLLLRSVAREKENRVVETLLTSTTPEQLLAGKTLGLGVIGMAMTVIWVGTLYGLFALGGQTLSIPEGITIPPSLVFWGVLFILFGYALYASLMAAAGAMISNMKEVTPASMVAMAPLILTYVLGLLFSSGPNSPLMVVLSYFPLSSPIAMMMRVGVVEVPFWQPLISLVLLAVTTYFVVRVAARLFRAQNLLSGQPFTATRFYGALLGRE